MLDRGKDLDWFASPAIVALAVVAVVGLAFFVVWELTDENPVVDLPLFARRNFAAGTLALCVGYAIYFGNVVLLPLWLQTQMAYTATWAGLASAPIGILPIVLAPIVGRYMSRIDLRWWATASFAALALTSFWYAGFNTQVTFGELAWSRFAQGLGLALFFPPLLTIVLSGLPANRVASAAGLSNTLRTMAGSFATSLTTTWWDRREALHQAHLTDRATSFDPSAQAALDQLHALGAHGDVAFAVVGRTIVQQAYMLATNDLFWLWGWLLFAMIGVLWLARPPFAAGGPVHVGD
jgi:MFS transporter, DHA2 family, multidrug resistance protein